MSCRITNLLTAKRHIFVGLAVLLLFSGMARRPMKDVEKKVQERSGIPVQNLKRDPEKKPAESPDNLSADRLPLDTALKIALTNNSEIQATFQDLGIARADVWQATLFKNPTFDGFVRFPNNRTIPDGDSTKRARNNVELSISQDFIDILLMPFKRRVATAEYDAVKLRVTDAVLGFILEVKKAYYDAQAAEESRALRKTALEAAEAAVELAERQQKAGALKELDLSAERVAYEETKLDYQKSLAEETLAREPLNRLIGLGDHDAAVWKINSPLKDLPEVDPKLDDLEIRAVSERLDLAAVRAQTKSLKRNLTATRLGIIPQAEIGLNTEKEIDGGRVSGPTWNVEVPVWDQQLAKGSKAKAQWRQSRFTETAYEIKVKSEVRQAVTHLQAARTAVESYRDKIIPEREKITGLLLLKYNYMLAGVYQLLDAKQKEVVAHREYIDGLKDYWSALAELERAVGGKLEPGEIKQKPKEEKESMPEPAPAESAMPMDHSHHQGGHKS